MNASLVSDVAHKIDLYRSPRLARGVELSRVHFKRQRVGRRVRPFARKIRAA